MERNTILAIALSSLVLIGSMFIQYKFFPPVPIEPTQTSQTASQPNVSPVNDAVNGTNAVTAIEPQLLVEADDVSADSLDSEVTEKIAEAQYTIKTNVIEAVFTNKGGDIVSYKLLDHKDGSDFVQMADNVTALNRGFSLNLGGTDGVNINAAAIDETFNTKVINDYTIIFTKNFVLKNYDGTTSTFTLAKRYTFKPDEYVFKLDIAIDGDESFHGLNVNNVGYTLRTFPQIGPYYNQKNNKYEYRTFMSYTGEKKKKQMLGAGQTKLYDKPFTWTGVAGKYFTVLVSPVNQEFGKVLYSMKENTEALYSDGQVFLMRNPISGNKVQDSFYVYAGPRTEEALKKYNNGQTNAWGVSGLRLNESMESTNILGWLEVLLKWIMEIFYKLIPNWGVSIILMTILLKVALFPLTKKSSVSTLKMQEVQPRVQELQAKYKNQPDKLNVEMSKLYQETGYNPLSGCLPLLIQFPLIFAMYNLFNNYFEFRGAMFIPGWIPDLSVGDKVYTFKSQIPLISNFVGNELHILPIIYLLSQLVFTKITQASTPTPQADGNKSMKLMMYIMPIMFFFIFYNAPAGLLLYWTLSNFLQLVQQLSINKIMKAKKEEMQNTPLRVVQNTKKRSKK